MDIQIFDTVRVSARMQDNLGNDIINVYYWTHLGASVCPDSAFMTAVEVELSDMYTTIQSVIPSTVSPVDVTADVVTYSGGKWTVTAHVGVIAWTTWGGGTGAGDSLPQGCAALVSGSTTVPKVYARKYLGQLTETAQDNGGLTSSVLAYLAAFATEWLDDMAVGANGFVSSVASLKAGTYLQLMSGLISSVVAYQRRRKTGRGS